MGNARKTSVRVDIDKSEYDDPMAVLEDAFFEAANLLLPEGSEEGDGEWFEVLNNSFFTVRFDDNGPDLAATVTSTRKKD